MKLFETGKTQMYLDAILHKNERRKGGEAKVVELVLRIQPFTSQLALAMDEMAIGARL